MDGDEQIRWRNMAGLSDKALRAKPLRSLLNHPRSYDREDMVFDPIRYLPLLEHKIGALDQAAPLAGWDANAFAPGCDGRMPTAISRAAAVRCRRDPE